MILSSARGTTAKGNDWGPEIMELKGWEAAFIRNRLLTGRERGSRERVSSFLPVHIVLSWVEYTYFQTVQISLIAYLANCVNCVWNSIVLRVSHYPRFSESVSSFWFPMFFSDNVEFAYMFQAKNMFSKWVFLQYENNINFVIVRLIAEKLFQLDS